MSKSIDEVYEEWHWGVPSSGRTDWKDADIDHALAIHAKSNKKNPKAEPSLVECGRLVEVHFREPGKRKDTIIRLTREEANGSHLCFDPNHPAQRLYMLCSPKFRDRIKQSFLRNPQYQSVGLSELARIAGGRHALRDYANVSAMPLGVCTHVVYACDKKGDGYSFYIHKLGEETGINPLVAADAKGRLWMAGGDYTVPNPGITN